MRGRLAVVLGIAFMPAGILAAQSGWSAFVSEREAQQQALAARQIHALSAAREDIAQLVEAAATLAANMDIYSASRCEPAVRASSEQNASLSLVYVVDDSARVVCSSSVEIVGAATRDMPRIDALRRSNGGTELRLVQGASIGPSVALGALSAAPPTREGARRYAGTRIAADRLLVADPETFVALITREGRLAHSVGTRPSHAVLNAAAQQLWGNDAMTSQTMAVDGYRIVGMEVGQGEALILRGWSSAWITQDSAFRLFWLLLAPIALWVAALTAAWFAVEIYCSRPLIVVERAARAYASGEEAPEDEALLRNAPVEIAILRSSLARMFGALRQRETRLSEALREERALLREVNHRVKNNLQMIASILSIQARAAGASEEAKGLLQAQDRVQLLALAYRRIYDSGEVHTVALDELAREVVSVIAASRQRDGGEIVLEFKMQPHRGSVSEAVPFAFLVGECVSQVLDARAGRDVHLCIELTAETATSKLEIKGPSWLTTAGSSVSQRLVSAFARQVQAQVSTLPEPGVLIAINLPHRSTPAAHA